MRRWMSMAAATMLLLAACGGGTGTAEPDDGPADTTGTPDESSPDSPDSPDRSQGGEESLAAFFGWDTEFNEADWQDQELRVQEGIRVCMAGQGFDYQPMTSHASGASVVDFDEEEWVRKQGFGITTYFGNDEEFQGDSGDQWVDPNQEILDAMSDSEREAWYAALYGTEEEQMEGSYTEVDPETGEEYEVMEGWGAGCQGKAYEAEYGEQSGSGLWEELGPEMEAMYERVNADPRIIEQQQGWSRCMAEAGYEYESLDAMHGQIYDDLYARFEEIVGPGGGYADPFEGWAPEEIDAFFEERSQEEIDAFFRDAERATREDIDMEALAALQQEEIDLAVADFECRGEGYWELWQEVATDYEADFIAQHREQLEAIRDAQGG